MSSSAPRSWFACSCVVAAAIGCQAMVSSALPRQRVVVMLPSTSADATLRDRFLQGYAVGEATVRACGHPVPPVRWIALRPDQSPLEQLPRHRDQHLVVAPPSADLRAFNDLSQQHGLSVLLPYQRGESIDTLRGLKGREKLWPLVPSIREDVKATVEATLKAGWDRAMVVADPSALEATLSMAFVDHYMASGGLVESYEPTPVQQVDPTDGQRLDRFRKDMTWSWAGTVVVADQPNGPLATRLRREQRDGAFGGGAPWTPNWVYLSDSSTLRDLPQVPWQQLGLEHPARGEDWLAFAEAFNRRWGQTPDLLAAAGYDTARVLALVEAAPLPVSDDGLPDPMGWVSPDQDAVDLCSALRQRQRGEALRLKAAASDFRLRGGMTPSGQAAAGLLMATPSDPMKADGKRADAATG